MERLDRREFLRRTALLGAGAGAAWLSGCGPAPTPALRRIATLAPDTPTPWATVGATASRPADTATPQPSPTAAPTAAAGGSSRLVVAHGQSPAENTRRVVAALGGIEKFVRPGADVIVKPNMCNPYHGPEYASTTNPEVVAAVVALCVGAGARRVRMMDFPFPGTCEEVYASSKIGQAVQAAGGEMTVMDNLNFVETEIPAGRKLKKWTIYDDVLQADALINIPIPKHHSATGLTMAMKNLMGVCMYRNGLHSKGLGPCIADINSRVRCILTVVDATRILMANGPTGGDLNDVKQLDTVIATTDVVAADAYAATFFGQSGSDMSYVQIASEMGLGEMDLSRVRVEELSV